MYGQSTTENQVIQESIQSRRDSPLDLSFSQVLDIRHSYTTIPIRRRRRVPKVRHPQVSNEVEKRNSTTENTIQVMSHDLSVVRELSEDIEEDESDIEENDSIYEQEDEIDYALDESRELSESDDWELHDGHTGADMYRFVQPRKLSSWVQDDAVYACFRCHTLFSMIVRKHHCRACGRIFCATCSTQRVVIPLDYESAPSNPSAYSIRTNATDLLGNLSWYVQSYSAPGSSTKPRKDRSQQRESVNVIQNEAQEVFLNDIRRLQDANILKFTPRKHSISSTGSTSSSTRTFKPIPDGAITQRVCDDCACALQQRRQHQDIVRVFELCEFDLQQLQVLGQVCRKWHRASIMCLSMFRQIQYYLPTHRLTQRERALLIINRKFLCGHSKWLLQLVKVIDFSLDHVEESNDPATITLANDIFQILQQERKHSCMLTMCSRLCQRELGSVDALEVLSDESIRNVRLRAMCVTALLKKATENEWWSFLPVLLHSLSIESNAAGSKLGEAFIRQAKCDVRFCYDLYWGLTVMAEDPSCRRKFDSVRQRLLLQLAKLSLPASSFGHSADQINPHFGCDITEQLLLGQELVDIMWKIPPRLPIDEARQIFQHGIENSQLFVRAAASTNGLLRLPVDPRVRVSGIDFKSIEIKRSAEAPMIISCTGVKRDFSEQNTEITSISPSKMSQLHDPPRSNRIYDMPFRVMYKRDDLRKDAIVQNIIHVMYLILKQETELQVPLVTYRVLPTSSYDGLIEIVENAHTLYSIIQKHGNIINFLHHYNGHRTISEISSSFRESLAVYTVITFLLGVGDRHADNVMLTKDGYLFHIDYGFILGKDPKPLQPPMRLDHYMIDALGGPDTKQYEQFKQLCVVAFNCLRRHVSLFMIMLTLMVKSIPEITDFGVNYTQRDLEAFIIERFLPGQSDDEAATALMLRMEGKFNEKLGLTLSDFVHAHSNENTVSKGMVSVSSSVKIGVEAVGGTVTSVASSLTTGASSIINYVWGNPPMNK